MNKEANQIELIEKYLRKNVTDEEAEEFRKLSSADPSFRELYKHMEVLIPGIENSARSSLLNDLKEIESRQPEILSKSGSISKPKIRLIGWSVAVAACIAGVVIAVTMLTPGNNRYDQIYGQYYKPYNSLTLAGTRSANSTNPLREEAFESYNNGDYQKAAGKFEQLEKNTNDVESLFYLANAYMATGKLEKAEMYFNEVLTHESLFTDQAKWYLALCYLKMNQPDKARKELKELINYRNDYTKSAEDVLYLVK